jgi:mannose-1-phosphate guanylyltransferase
VDGETLLDRTRHRVDLLVPAERQVVVVSRGHAPFYRYLVDDRLPDRLVVQPTNRGTGAGVLYPLLRIQQLAGEVPVAVFPSDHHVSDDAKFMGYVLSALEVVAARPRLVVLLGIEAEYPEPDYGWIEPGREPLSGTGAPVLPVLRFWEKPSASLAQQLLAGGGLWNSFVMVGWVYALFDLVRATARELAHAFEIGRPALCSSAEPRVMERIYHRLPCINFSEQVLAAAPDRLATIAVKGVEWSDWGTPERVIDTLRRAGRRPEWLSRISWAPVVTELSLTHFWARSPPGGAL